jgi:formylmethanofuran dehydrogenase subunit C
MKLKRFMDEAYGEKGRSRRLETRRGDQIFGLEDLADHVGQRPSRAMVEELMPADDALLAQMVATDPGKKYAMIWGILSSIAAERSHSPLRLIPRDYAGLELCAGTIILEDVGDRAGDHVGERMRGGRIFTRCRAGDYLGQEMAGGGIVTIGCGNYAFRNMHGGRAAVLGDAGNCIGLGNCGGRIAVRGSCGERAGWLMRAGSLRVRKDAGDYLGLLMSGGTIRVLGKAGRRAGWRMKGGSIEAEAFGPEAADKCISRLMTG